MLARIIVQKFRFGMPYFRQEELLEADGISLEPRHHEPLE